MKIFGSKHSTGKKFAIAAGGVLGIPLLWLGATWLTLPSASRLAAANPNTTAFIERFRSRADSDSALPQLQWKWVAYGEISVHMKRAAVVAEDIEFFSHSGFSQSEISAAVRQAIRDREAPRGASTISQQTAKNLWLSPSRNPTRKLKELFLTRRLERALPKSRILEIYLNIAEFGVGLYGVEAAAHFYFNKPAAGLTEHESAMLAASLPRPSSWNPNVDDPYYLGYVDDIEYRLDQAEFLWRHIDPTRNN